MKRAFTLVTALLLASPGAGAAMYKCVGAGGKQTFQQQPCPSTSTESRVKTDSGDWLTVVAGRPLPNNSEVTMDIALDLARIKTQGEFTLAVFREITHSKWDKQPRPVLLYVRYHCAKGRVAGPESKPEELDHDWLDPYATYRNKKGAYYPFADEAIIEKVCATSAPAARAAPPGGPEGGVYTAKPEGVTISETTPDGEWINVRGTAESTAAVRTFMRNLEAGPYESAVLKKISGGEYELAVRLRKL